MSLNMRNDIPWQGREDLQRNVLRKQTLFLWPTLIDSAICKSRNAGRVHWQVLTRRGTGEAQGGLNIPPQTKRTVGLL